MIEVRDLHVGYGKQEIIHGVNLCFQPGMVTGILGKNGCGKSTLLKAVAGLLPASGGEVLVGGTPLRKLSPQQMAQRVSYLPQSRNIPDLSVRRMVLHGRFAYLSYPRHYRKQDYEMAQTAMEWVGVDHLAEMELKALSGGQRQKVYIAMALAQDTGSVLMDEPTTYLDIHNQMETMELARRLAADGKAVVMVLHDLQAVLRYTDRVVLMDQGRVVTAGTPEEVYASGELDRIFEVELHSVDTPQGRRYYY